MVSAEQAVDGVDVLRTWGDAMTVASNINAAPIVVYHCFLKRADSESRWRSDCPACKEGMLLVARCKTSFVLLENDRCTLCGQSFKYADIDEMREADNRGIQLGGAE